MQRGYLADHFFDPRRLAEETLLALGHASNYLIEAAKTGLRGGGTGEEDRPRDQRLVSLAGVGIDQPFDLRFPRRRRNLGIGHQQPAEAGER